MPGKRKSGSLNMGAGRKSGTEKAVQRTQKGAPAKAPPRGGNPNAGKKRK